MRQMRTVVRCRYAPLHSAVLWRSERHRYGVPVWLEYACSKPVVGILGSLERPRNEIWRILGRSAEHGELQAGTIRAARSRTPSTAIIAA
jgi:hypothetical protein